MESPSARPRWQPPFKPLKTSNPVRRDMTVAPTTHKEYVTHKEYLMTEDKEKSVQEPQAAAPQTAQKVTLQDIRTLILFESGIKRNDVYKALVFSDGSNKKKVGDLVSFLISSKQITQNEEAGVKRLYPGPNFNDALAGKEPVTPKEKGIVEPKEKVPALKLLAGEDARPLQHASFPTRIQETLPAAPAAVQSRLSNPTLADHLAAVAAALPTGVILGIFRGNGGKMEFTLDTSSGATFNMGESLVGAVNGIDALATLQPFAEN